MDLRQLIALCPWPVLSHTISFTFPQTMAMAFFTITGLNGQHPAFAGVLHRQFVLNFTLVMHTHACEEMAQA